MPCIAASGAPHTESTMCYSLIRNNNYASHSIFASGIPLEAQQSNSYCQILPGLPDEVAMICLSFVPRLYFPVMGAVCKKWRSCIQSKEFMSVRKEIRKAEEWLFVLTAEVDSDSKHGRWEILDCYGKKCLEPMPMPGPIKSGFGVVVLDGRLLVMAGYSTYMGTASVSNEVYQFDSRLNRWSSLAKLNVARFDFACAEVNGIVYAVGGYGSDGYSLSSAEAYNSEKNKWTLIESLRQPRWGCFACGLRGKLYVMGGRSSSAIGHSRFVDVYDPGTHTWCKMKNGCVMVTAHAVLGKQLFCMEWRNQRKMTVFDSSDNSWMMIPLPHSVTALGFQFAVLDGKLLLLSQKKNPGYQTLIYDPEAPKGSEWHSTSVKSSGLCLSSVTISV